MPGERARLLRVSDEVPTPISAAARVTQSSHHVLSRWKLQRRCPGHPLRLLSEPPPPPTVMSVETSGGSPVLPPRGTWRPMWCVFLIGHPSADDCCPLLSSPTMRVLHRDRKAVTTFHSVCLRPPLGIWGGARPAWAVPHAGGHYPVQLEAKVGGHSQAQTSQTERGCSAGWMSLTSQRLINTESYCLNLSPGKYLDRKAHLPEWRAIIFILNPLSPPSGDSVVAHAI